MNVNLPVFRLWYDEISKGRLHQIQIRAYLNKRPPLLGKKTVGLKNWFGMAHQITMPKKKIAQLFEDSWFVHRRWNYKKSVSILKSFKKSINWVVSERCSSKTLKTTMIWSKYVNSAYCQKERFHISLWTVPFTFI